jgi:hypothetical protein
MDRYLPESPSNQQLISKMTEEFGLVIAGSEHHLASNRHPVEVRSTPEKLCGRSRSTPSSVIRPLPWKTTYACRLLRSCTETITFADRGTLSDFPRLSAVLNSSSSSRFPSKPR